MRSITVAVAVLALGSQAARGQQPPAGGSPLERATESPADKPVTVNAATPDADVGAFLKALAGTYRFEAGEGAKERPALVLHAAPIAVDSMVDTALVEIARADAPATPFRVYVLHPYRRQGVLRLRQFELPGPLREALAGCWAAADALPKLDASLLTPSLDMPLSATKGSPAEYHAATDHPFPTTRDGAIEMTAGLDLTPVSLQLTDAGFDADGKQVWGAGTTGGKADAAAKGNAVEFTRAAHAENPAKRDDSGVVVIPLVRPAADATKLQTGGKVTFHYTSWLTNGTMIESSRIAGHQPATVPVPSNILAGLNKGLAGIAKGERRRIIIPPAQAYGDLGRGVIPPNATLIFDIECVGVDNTPEAPAATPRPMMNPHTGERVSPPPAPSDPNAPIGTPPTNPEPETPRR